MIKVDQYQLIRRLYAVDLDCTVNAPNGHNPKT
jgi:hypothetical protein